MSMSDVVAENLRVTRKRRGLTVRALSARLGDLGFSLVPSGVTKVETADASARRRIDVDDLAALALALDSSPVALLTPGERQDVAVTPSVSVRGQEVGEWVRGDEGLPIEEEGDEERERRRRNFHEGAPPAGRAEPAGSHPLLVSVLALEDLAREALEPGGPRESPLTRSLIENLQRQVRRVDQYVELLIDELEHDEPGEA